MKKIHRIILASGMLLSSLAAFAQTRIKGVVYDADGPLPGAGVMIQGSQTGTTTAMTVLSYSRPGPETNSRFPSSDSIPR